MARLLLLRTLLGVKQTWVSALHMSAMTQSGHEPRLFKHSFQADTMAASELTMKRRVFIKVLGGVVLTWPLALRAQQKPRLRRVGVLIPFPDDREPLVKDYLSAFKQRLHELGWDEGRNIQVDYRFTDQVPQRMRAGAVELISLAPDIIVVWANPSAAIMRKATQTIPVVFVVVSDPLGAGIVTNLAHPGENITGFQNFETDIGGKWLQVLKEIAPGLKRVAFVHSGDIPAHVAFMRTAQAASNSLGVAVIPADVRVAVDIEPALRAAAREPDGGFIVAPSPLSTVNQERLIALASELRLPAIYPFHYFAEKGGLASYGFDTVEQRRGAASYVDRILKGEKPGNLPVQAPTKYDLVINLKTAKGLSLNVSTQMQQRADKVIE